MVRSRKQGLLLFGWHISLSQSQWNGRDEFCSLTEGVYLVKPTWVTDRESATRVGSWEHHQRMCTLVQLCPWNREQSSFSVGNTHNATRHREGRTIEKNTVGDTALPYLSWVERRCTDSMAHYSFFLVHCNTGGNDKVSLIKMSKICYFVLVEREICVKMGFYVRLKNQNGPIFFIWLTYQRTRIRWLYIWKGLS